MELPSKSEARQMLADRLDAIRIASTQTKLSLNSEGGWGATVMALELSSMLFGNKLMCAEYAAALLRIVELEDKLASLEQREVAA